MRVIIHFDAFWRGLELKQLCNTAQQFGLCRCLGEFARQTFFCIAQGARNQLLLFTALGHQNFYPTAAFIAEQFSHQIYILKPMRKQDLPRRLFAVIKLAQKRL